ncbi:hypothetical protein THTE_1336 [Thermogutta terrifontis]|uniref:Uncharacterized protein n=1 Tax=Thermogutta terrifontis TaxID=1331910 RepID=A0A286RD97_9BACT|nr:hypothetical protein THTE_1336 [Thermogutta terrifontis]
MQSTESLRPRCGTSYNHSRSVSPRGSPRRCKCPWLPKTEVSEAGFRSMVASAANDFPSGKIAAFFRTFGLPERSRGSYTQIVSRC